MGAILSTISGGIQPDASAFGLPGATNGLPPRNPVDLNTGAGQPNPAAVEAYLQMLQRHAAGMQALQSGGITPQVAINAMPTAFPASVAAPYRNPVFTAMKSSSGRGALMPSGGVAPSNGYSGLLQLVSRAMSNISKPAG